MEYILYVQRKENSYVFYVRQSTEMPLEKSLVVAAFEDSSMVWQRQYTSVSTPFLKDENAAIARWVLWTEKKYGYLYFFHVVFDK